MAFKVDSFNVSLNYCTHLPALMRAFERTSGPVLELGMGLGSTPYLHYACLLAGRPLVSYESDAGWAARFEMYRGALHEISVVDDWKEADLDEWWAVALIDHTDADRAPAIARLANSVQYIIAHDANARFDKLYRYSTVYPLFKYRTVWDRDARHTVVLSNFVDLQDFWQ